jgi:hypothetical protein
MECSTLRHDIRFCSTKKAGFSEMNKKLLHCFMYYQGYMLNVYGEQIFLYGGQM